MSNETETPLKNFLSGTWQSGSGTGSQLINPCTGEILATVSSTGLDLNAALEFSREHGAKQLQSMTYKQRAELLAKLADLLQSHRAEYFEICQRNMGATEADCSFDIDGAIYTLKQYAKWGQALDGKLLKEGSLIPLSKTGVFSAQHFLKPLEGVAVFINAFNFPAWGLWEKAAPALLSGVAVLVKPATPTAWLTQRMVEDVVKADILPPGALSIVCGPARDLLDHVRENDVISFTGSAQTATSIRQNLNVLQHSVRINIEADSLNAAILGPGETVAPGTSLFDLFVKEIVREMTLKAGQKCTAIRRIIAPRRHSRALANAISAKLAQIKVGNPSNPEIKCGPLVNKAQQNEVLKGIRSLASEAEIIFGNAENFQPIDADSNLACFVQPTLLYCENPLKSKLVNELEIFGPVATILPYDSTAEAVEIARRGSGSLVASIFSDVAEFKADITLGIAGTHGRIMAVDSSVGAQHTGHGNVMPNCLHGGPGRAGSGEELAGLRALALYHRRFVVQGPPELLNSLSENAVDAALLCK